MVSRTARFREAPSLSCIESAIRSADGLDEVRHEIRPSSSKQTWFGLQHQDEIHYFMYRSGTWNAVVQVTIDYTGKASMVDYWMGAMDERHVKAKEDAVRPLLDRVEHAIAQQCGIEWPRPSFDLEID
jgi:hypothetical protein